MLSLGKHVDPNGDAVVAPSARVDATKDINTAKPL
jgi:hypothetical protein